MTDKKYREAVICRKKVCLELETEERKRERIRFHGREIDNGYREAR